jgi:hypothetical protein
MIHSVFLHEVSHIAVYNIHRMQSPPPFHASLAVNANLLSLGDPQFFGAGTGAREGIFSAVIDMATLLDVAIKKENHERYHESLVNYQASNTRNAYQHPHAIYMEPIMELAHNPNSDNDMQEINPVAGFLLAIVPWDRFLIDLLPVGAPQITCVLSNTWGQSFTYNLEGNSVCTVSRR